jgi:hypothetical protein
MPFAPPGGHTHSRSAWCSTIGAQGASAEATKRMADVSGYTKGSSLSGKQTTSMFAGSARSRGRTDNRGECLHTSKRTRGPQRSAKTGLHQGDATPSSKNQDPAQKSQVGGDRETGKSVQKTADQHIKQGRITAVILRGLSACNRTSVWHGQIICETTKKACVLIVCRSWTLARC